MESHIFKHGRPQTFSRAEQNIPEGGGGKHTICEKKHLKHTIFLKKSRITFYFGRPEGWGGEDPIFPFHADGHDIKQHKCDVI